MQDSMPYWVICLRLLVYERQSTMHCASLCSLLFTLFVELSSFVVHRSMMVHSVGCCDAKSEWCNIFLLPLSHVPSYALIYYAAASYATQQ
jgi:hypothetical protein